MKKTDELEFELTHTKSIQTYMEENAAHFNEEAFVQYLSALVKQCGKTKTKIAADSHLSEPFLYNLLRAEKRPTKESVVKLAFGLSLDLPKTERLLQLAGHSRFYVRQKKDSLLMHAIQNNMDITEADNLLAGYGFSVVGE